MNKKGISPLIASLMLILIVVAIMIIVFEFNKNMVDNAIKYILRVIKQST